LLLAFITKFIAPAFYLRTVKLNIDTLLKLVFLCYFNFMSLYLIRLRHLVLFSTLSISCPHLFLMGCLLMRYNMVSQPHTKIFILLAFVFFLIYKIMFFINLPLVVLIVYFLVIGYLPRYLDALIPLYNLSALLVLNFLIASQYPYPWLFFSGSLVKVIPSLIPHCIAPWWQHYST